MQDVQQTFSSKQEFVRSLAYDLKTPLGVIDVVAGLALSHPDDERRVTKYLHTILKSVDRLNAMVADLLDLDQA